MSNKMRVHTLAWMVALVVVIALGIYRPQPVSASSQSGDPVTPVVQPGDDDARCDDPANPVVAENCLPGTDDWIIRHPLNDIAGFAYPPSINLGESLNLYVDTSADLYDIQIYRSGYYGGAGGRLIDESTGMTGQVQPECHHEFETGLTSCSNWELSYTMDIPEDWVSGIYIAKLIRQDTQGESYALFVLRDDERDAPILYQQSLFTFHAYNNYGGKSLYTVNSSGCPTEATTPRAPKVSLMRPFSSEQVTLGQSFNHYMNVEFPMVRWLEEQGYDVSYSSNIDTHLAGAGAANEILDHQAFLSVGHDEYWTYEMRDAVVAARDAGVNLAFFSSNVSYWRVRLEDDPWSGEPDSVVVTYKTTENGIDDPSGDLTSTFRDPERTDQPEGEWVGIQYVGDNDALFFPVRVTAEQAQDSIYRHTALQTMPDDTYINIGTDLVGWEWDTVSADFTPPDGLEVLASSPVYGLRLLDAGNFEQGTSRQSEAQVTRYTADSGAVVFAFGTNQWGWGLGARGIDQRPPDPLLQQITYNILADMGVQPGSPVEDIILDGEDGVIAVDESRFWSASDMTPPTIDAINVYAPGGDLLGGGRSARFQWWTETPTMGQVWLGEEEGHTIEPLGNFDSYARFHQLTIANLVPDTDYYYKIVAVDENWQITDTEEGHFHTPSNFVAQNGRWALQSLQSVQCWATQYPTGARLIAVGVVLGLVALVGLGVVWIQRRRRRRMTRNAGQDEVK